MTLQVEKEIFNEQNTELEDANLFSVIVNRRATRNYLAKSVSEEMIRDLINFSIQAPSAMNLQPWCFVVIQNAKILNEISEEAKKRIFRNPHILKEMSDHGVHLQDEKNFDIFYGASTLIVICAKKKNNQQFSAEADCFLAGENLMLAATGMGLATCPIGLATDILMEREMRKKIGIEPDFIPVLPIIVGYASTNPARVQRHPPIIKWLR